MDFRHIASLSICQKLLSRPSLCDCYVGCLKFSAKHHKENEPTSMLLQEKCLPFHLFDRQASNKYQHKLAY